MLINVTKKQVGQQQINCMHVCTYADNQSDNTRIPLSYGHVVPLQNC